MKKKTMFHISLVVLIITLVFSCRKNDLSQSNQQRSFSPSAQAGQDQTIQLPIDSVVLDGSNSFDYNSSIVSYKWRVLSTTFTPTIKHDTSKVTTVHFSRPGSYYFELTVKNSLLGISKDTCRVIVQELLALNPNLLLRLKVDPYDTILNLPLNSILINPIAYLIDGRGSFQIEAIVKSVEWKKVAGPSNFSIQSPDKLVTTIKNLTQGTYAFECAVTDKLNRKYSGSTVVRVSDPTAPEQELIIKNLKWNLEWWAPYAELNVTSFIPENKCIKKVLVKSTCAPSYTEAFPYWVVQNSTGYYYHLYYSDNQIRLYILDENYDDCFSETMEIKIIY